MDASKGKIVWSNKEPFSVWSGVLTTAGGIACYGTLEGYFKCDDQKDGKNLYKFKTPSGIVGNVFTYAHKGKQYIGVFSGVGGWAGIGLAAGLTNPKKALAPSVAMPGLRATRLSAVRCLSGLCRNLDSRTSWRGLLRRLLYRRTE